MTVYTEQKRTRNKDDGKGDTRKRPQGRPGPAGMADGSSVGTPRADKRAGVKLGWGTRRLPGDTLGRRKKESLERETQQTAAQTF